MAMIDDETFVQQFEAGQWPPEQWHHAQHIKISYLYLRRYPFETALDRIRAKIQALNLAHHVPDGPTRGYHETMTRAWMQLVNTSLIEYGPADTADRFCEMNPQLMEKKNLRLFYTPERMLAPRAKIEFVEPDLAPLPRPRHSGLTGSEGQAPSEQTKPPTSLGAAATIPLSQPSD